MRVQQEDHVCLLVPAAATHVLFPISSVAPYRLHLFCMLYVLALESLFIIWQLLGSPVERSLGGF